MAPNDRIDSGSLIAGGPLEQLERAGPAGRRAVYSVARTQAHKAALEPVIEGNGFTYRHDWGVRSGQWILSLDLEGITPRSRVFVAIGEGTPGEPDAGKFIGGARYTVHNVAPRPGGVNIWVNIEWDEDISLFADYLVVNPPGVPTRTVQVVVHRHHNVLLSEAEADRILADMGTILQNVDSETDVATPVQYVRNGEVRVLPPTVPGTIQTEEDYAAVINAGTGVKVVEAIRWCSGPSDTLIGCAPIGSANVNLAVVRWVPEGEGLLWAHEYGHNASLNHRTDDPRAIMYPILVPGNAVVDAVESQAFLSGPVTISGAVMRGCGCDSEGMQAPSDVRDFVSRHWVEGVPYRLASQYTEQDAMLLLEWLVDEPGKHEEFLSQIVATLGFIGSEIAVRPLIDFVESPQAGRAVFNAKNSALIRLGDLAYKSGSKTALDFLAAVASGRDKARDLAAPQARKAAADAVAGIAVPGAATLGAELAVSATFGLALSGKPEAAAVIEALKGDREAFVSVNRAAVEAADIARTVRTRGQQEYYRMKAGHPQHL